GLYPLRPDPDKEFIEAARSVIRSQSAALVQELGIPGGPRLSRVDQIFSLLLGDPETNDPDLITGELGTLRIQLGLRVTPPLVTPAVLALGPGQAQQFVAAGLGSVTWSISPSSGVGSIGSATGLYAAPTTITVQRIVSVIATSTTFPGLTARAT